MTIDLTIDERTVNIKFHNIKDYSSYFVGWTTGTTEDFAALTADQMMALVSERKQGNPYSGQFGRNQIFFLLHEPGKAPSNVVLTSAEVDMVQNINEDSTCHHTDVVMGGLTYKVFGIRFYSPEATDSVTVNF